MILHNDGKRELYFFRHAHDDEPRAVIALDDDEARQLGAVIGGPMSGRRSRGPGDGARRAPDRVGAGPGLEPLDRQVARRGRLSEHETGVTVIAILREPEPISGAQPQDIVQRGDTLVTVGKAGQYPEFRRLPHRTRTRPAAAVTKPLWAPWRLDYIW